jgi:hypothetical protein
MVSTNCNYGISNSNATHRGILTTCHPNIDPKYTLHRSIRSTLYKARTPMATTRAPLTKLAAPAPVVCWGRADEAALVMELAAAMEAVLDPLIMAELIMALAGMELAMEAIMEVPEAAAAAEERG